MGDQQKPTVVVVGATSKQGPSVVCSLLQSAKFDVKALTLDSNSPRAHQPACLRGHALSALPWTYLALSYSRRWCLRSLAVHESVLLHGIISAVRQTFPSLVDVMVLDLHAPLGQGRRTSQSAEPRLCRATPAPPTTCIAHSRCRHRMYQESTMLLCTAVSQPTRTRLGSNEPKHCYPTELCHPGWFTLTAYMAHAQFTDTVQSCVDEGVA